MTSDQANGNARDTTDAALVCIDLVDSTRLIQTLGDGRGAIVLGRFADLARTAFSGHGGREIDHTDGFLVLFRDCPSALAMALQLHADIARLGHDSQARISARIGIHHDVVMTRANPPDAVARGAKALEVEGLGKAICARICALAEGGQTLLSGEAFRRAQYAGGSALDQAQQLRWLSHGLYALKGIDDPVSIHEIGHVDHAPLRAPGDAEKSRALRDDNLLTGWRAGTGQAVPGRDDWMLERKLGEGGFGDAWLARQQDSGALHVFKFCFQLGKLQSLQREVALFRLMQRALGDRQDIVQLLGWQLDAPPYYIESEYSAQGDLQRWMQRRGGFAAVDLDTRLRLVAEVADALAAAHAVGVLHKDVKPSNVLIAQDAQSVPRARLADFGIGSIDAQSRYRFGDGVVLTGMTELLIAGDSTRTSGTRMYMAPEQIEGHAATTHADVYALGVLLYQMVCGDFGVALAPGWERDIDDPLLRDDIADLTARNPQNRIANLEQMAARLRDLDQRRAQRQALQLRQAREARLRRLRRWAVPTAGALLALVLLLGWGITRISQEAQRANEQAATAEAVTGFLISMFQQADPEHVRGDQLTVREVLDAGVINARQELEGQPQVRSRLLAAMGEVYMALGLFKQAHPVLAQAWQDGAPVMPLGSPERARLRLSRMDAEDALGDYDAALALGQQQLDEAQRAHGNHSIPAAMAHMSLGNSYNGLRHNEQAAAQLEQATRLLAELAPGERDHADALWMLAVSYIHLQQPEQALRVLEQSLAIIDALDDHSPMSRAAIHETAAGALRNQGQFRESLQQLRHAQQLYLQMKLDSHTSYGSTLFNLANLQGLLGEFESARNDFERTLALYRGTFGEQPYPSYALTLKALGGTLTNLHRYTEAEPLLREALQQYEAMPHMGAEHPPRMQSMIAVALAGQGNTQGAVRMAEAALAELASQRSEDPRSTAVAASYIEAALALAQTLYMAQRADDATQVCADTLAHTGLEQQQPLVYRTVREAKLLLCARRADEAHLSLQALTQWGYRDAFLDALIGTARL